MEAYFDNSATTRVMDEVAKAKPLNDMQRYAALNSMKGFTSLAEITKEAGIKSVIEYRWMKTF